MALPPLLQRYVDQQIKAGRFKDAGDAVSDGIQLLERRDRVAAKLRSNLDVLGEGNGEDIMALAFIVMMEAAKSAQDDLREIMASVKAINAAKSRLRDLISKVGNDVAANVGQRDGKPPLKFGVRGVGAEKGYHRLPVPHATPELPNGFRLVATDMHDGAIMDVAVLRAIQDELKNSLDSLSELGEMESLRLQMAMDRVSKLMTTLSNLLKKISDTESSIIQNLK
jgi:Arc/MetJ-type ribon-helix-helix transcriptional regulator